MSRIRSTNPIGVGAEPTRRHHARAFPSRLGALASLLALVGCATEPSSSDDGSRVASIGRALTQGEGSCGLTVAAGLLTEHGNGDYRAEVTLTNVSGEPATEFDVILDLDGSTITNGQQAVYTELDGEYHVTAPNRLQHNPLEPGERFTFKFNGDGPYRGVNAYVISVNGVPCDTATPQVTLAADHRVTASGPMTLTAETTDDVAVRKVVFEQDGVVIGEDSTAPYALEVNVTGADNGLRLFSATAVDWSGNEGSASARTVVAIDNRFFGTATAGENTYANVDRYFDQITPENAGKWESIEATRDEMSWEALDRAYDYAKDHGLPFRFHTLVWGNQVPAWLAPLTQEEQVQELEELMAAVAERYPDIDLIDVVNEPLHKPPPFKEGLGGDGETGWDWVIRSFELAMGYFPNAILTVNDYNILIREEFTASYLPIIDALDERGLVDAIGVQGHFLEQADPAVVAANLDRLAATGLGIYVTEFDVNYADDARQAGVFSDLVATFYENPAVLGVTAWGHLQGAIWRQDAWLLDAEGNPRPALDWLVCYRAGGEDCPVPVYTPTPREGDAAGLLIEVESYDDAEGLVAIEGSVAYTGDGSWMSLDRVVFDENWDRLSITYAKGNDDPASVEIYLDRFDHAKVATIPLASTGSWGGNTTLTVPWAPVSGEHDLLVKFNGPNGVANVDKIKFSAPDGLGASIIAGGDFEANTSGWYSWGSPAPSIATTDSRAFTGTRSLWIGDRTGNNPAATDLTAKVVPGTSYQTSFWVSIGGAGAADVNVTEKIQCEGQEAEYTWLGQVNVTDGGWAEIAGLVEIPDCTLAKVELYAEGPGAGIDLYVDHVSMRPLIVDERVNIVDNGGFESGSVGAWHTWNDGSIAVTQEAKHSGNYALIVTNRAANAPAAYDLGALVPGASYDVSFWVSILGGESAKVNVTQAVTCDGVTSYSWLQQVSVAEGAWTEIAGSVVMPDCDAVSLKLWAEGDTGVDLLVDDVVVLAPVSPPSEPEGNLVTGTFESGSASWYTWGEAMEVTSERSHTGDYSLKVTGSGVGKAVLQMNELLVPGETYELSYWVSIEGAASAEVHVTNTADCGAGAEYRWLTNNPTVTAGGWVNLSGTYTVPADCTLADAQFYVEGGNVQGSTGTISLYVDDVVIRQQPAVVTVLASDFEANMDGWYSWGSEIGLSTAVVHGGAQSLAVTDATVGKAVVQMSSLLEPGETYDVSYWVTIGGADSASINVTNTADCGDGPQYVWIASRQTVTAGAWTELTGSYTVPEGCTLVDAQFYVEGRDLLNPTDTVTLYVDDVLVTK